MAPPGSQNPRESWKSSENKKNGGDSYTSIYGALNIGKIAVFRGESAVYQTIGPHPAAFYDGASFLGAIWYSLLHKLGYEISAQSDHSTSSYGPLNLHRYGHFGPNRSHVWTGTLSITVVGQNKAPVKILSHVSSFCHWEQ